MYTNYDDMRYEVRKWLQNCPPHTTLGLGIDCSDSLLYDRYTGISQWIIPLFGDSEQNPNDAELVLLTKSANVDQLQDLPHNRKTVVSFSLNPQEIASLWEGIAPPIERRLEAGLKVQSWGYDYRWRIDPILTPPGWQDIYLDFFRIASEKGHRPSRITLGTYRQKNTQLLAWANKWGMVPMDWEPPHMVKEGSHYHVPSRERHEIYADITPMLKKYFPDSKIALCKETHALRKQLGLCNALCNCLNSLPPASL
jgi:DNA repair photolyase